MLSTKFQLSLGILKDLIWLLMASSLSSASPLQTNESADLLDYFVSTGYSSADVFNFNIWIAIEM